MTAGDTRGESRRPGTESGGAAFIQSFVDDGLEIPASLGGSRQRRVALLIDPLRDVDPYLAAANRLGVRITHVLDTHLHNDFLSGAREVAARIGVEIGASAGAGLESRRRPREPRRRPRRSSDSDNDDEPGRGLFFLAADRQLRPAIPACRPLLERVGSGAV